MHKIIWLKLKYTSHNVRHIETIISVILLLTICGTQSAGAITRFEDRSLLISNSVAGGTASYTLTMNYNTQTTIGSMNLLFCNDPIPYDPCVAPTGIDVSNAVLATQDGETGYAITTHSSNQLVLSRAPAGVGTETSTYRLENIVNPTDTTQSFSIRISDYASTNATGPVIDQGAVISEVTPSVLLETQVPPLLIFCLAKTVAINCSQGDGGNYTDMGTLNPNTPLIASSQMAAGTNASQGYAITISGTTLSAGSNGITPLSTPTPSIPGQNQFGINLVANSDPDVGQDPDGSSNNTVIGEGYDTPNKYSYKDGDVIVSAPNVSLEKRFTVSYVVNSASDLAPGVYTTTLTFVCSGRF